ncbi:AraC family transcriptional regulator [Niallia circulans]|uniref:AraC family transcriptional regulator n=1 Tax=Niallia TaxID=2837506 RepID=UPI000BA66BA0|nr:helix-turn-helix domain-containing protein [Niallia circulans]PAE13329.1 AraC family transcriptional regulator [Niallia circulans]
MDHVLMEQLRKLTEEEISIVQQKQGVMKDIYTSQSNFIIESEKFLRNDKMIAVRKHTRFIDFPKHKHNYIEINYVVNGQLKQKVGNDEIVLKRGELLFLNQHIEHEIEACDKEDIVVNFIIQPPFFQFIFQYLHEENKLTDFLISSLFKHKESGQYLYYKVSEVIEIQDIIGKLLKEESNNSILSESTMKLYMGLLMIELIKNTDKIQQNEGVTQDQYVVIEALTYIEEHYQLGTLNELAGHLHQSTSSLSKNIKKATGYTFKELLQEKRLSEAKNLLETTDLPIKRIIEEVGYDNISYFYRIFKEKYGMTPKAFRLKLAK